MDQEHTADDRGRAAAASGLRAKAADAWSGLVAGLRRNVARPSGAHPPHPHPPAPRIARPPSACDDRRDCRRCAADFDRAMRQVEAANEAKSRFIATVSHELRTPLNAVIGFSQIIRDDARRGGGSALHADFAQEIYDSGIHLMEIINRILELADMDGGRRTPNPEVSDTQRLFDDALRAASAAAAAAGVSLSGDVAPDAATVNADRAMVKQIIGCLLSNAVKFTPRGGSARLSARRDDDRIIIAVRDDGIGIAPENLGRVFQPFWQASPTMSRDYDGAGLGLTLVKAMTELHGGEVLIDSEPGRGTEVRAALPVPPPVLPATVACAPE